MKRQFLKCSLVLLLVASFSADAVAQRRGNKRTNPPANNQQQQTNNQNPPTEFPTSGNIPYRRDSTTGGGLDTTIRRSLRQESAFPADTNSRNQVIPLDYEHLRWDDALYAEKVWRELDLREKMNQPFRYAAKESNGDQQFIAILLNAVRTGKVMAFADDRFTQPLSLDEVQGTISGGATADTTPVYDLTDPTKIIEYTITTRSFNPNDVMKLRIKEEWIFDREASRMFSRIIGICPVKTVYIEGTKRERGVEPMFWIYYPDLRPTLANYSVYNSKNMGASRMTWEELFEARMFSSYIVNSTLDNPSMRYLSARIKDPILRLLEGENIKERIFNYEQDLWSY